MGATVSRHRWGRAGGTARHRGSRTVLAGLVALTALALLQDSALAHGSTVVPTARIEADADTLRVHWSAAEDDAAAIAISLGMAPPDALNDYLVGLAALEDGADAQPLIDELLGQIEQDRLLGSAELDAYLLNAIAVHQDGQPCLGAVGPTEEFITAGASLAFRCPQTVRSVEITIAILTEQDPTHRTYSIDGRGGVEVHSQAAPTHTWDLVDTTGNRQALAVITLGLAISVAVGSATMALLHRPGAAAGRRRVAPARQGREPPETDDARATTNASRP